MIGKILILCLAVMTFAAKNNEIHYHYHMDNQSSPKLAHKGARWCRTKVWSSFYACMSWSFYSKEKRDACRAQRTDGLANCAQQYEEPVVEASVQTTAEPASRLLNKKRNHLGVKATFCRWRAGFTLSNCNFKARFGGSDEDKAKKRQECQNNYNLTIAECNAQRALTKMSKRHMSAQQHLFWCEHVAKHKWFWCNLWAKVRGGDNKDANIASCENRYNDRIAVCSADSAPAQTQEAPVNNVPASSNTTAH